MFWLFLGVVFAVSIQPNGYVYSDSSWINLNITGNNCLLNNQTHWFYDGNGSLRLWLPFGYYNLTLECDGGEDNLDLFIDNTDILYERVENATELGILFIPPKYGGNCYVNSVLLDDIKILNEYNGTLNCSYTEKGFFVWRLTPTEIDTLTLGAGGFKDLENVSYVIVPVVVGSSMATIDSLNITNVTNGRFSAKASTFSYNHPNISVENSSYVSIHTFPYKYYYTWLPYNATLHVKNSIVFYYAHDDRVSTKVYVENSTVVIAGGSSYINARNSLIIVVNATFLYFNTTNTSIILNHPVSLEGNYAYIIGYDGNLDTHPLNYTSKSYIVFGKNTTWNISNYGKAWYSDLFLNGVSNNLTLFYYYGTLNAENATVGDLHAYNAEINLWNISGVGGAGVGFYAENSTGILNASFCGYNDLDVWAVNSSFNIASLTCNLASGIVCNNTCSPIAGFKSLSFKVDSPTDVENATILMPYFAELLPGACDGIYVYRDGFLPTQAFDCRGYGKILFKANLSAGNNTFTLLYGNTSTVETFVNYTEVYNNTVVSQKWGSKEITLNNGYYENVINTSLEGPYYGEATIIFEDFFYPGNNFTIYVGSNVIFNGTVNSQGLLNVSVGSWSNTIITHPGPISFVIENNSDYPKIKLYVGRVFYAWAYVSPYSGPLKIRLEGNGKILLKRFYGINNIANVSVYVPYNIKLPFYINASKAGVQSAAVILKNEFSPYYVVNNGTNDLPTQVYCVNNMCVLGFEANFTEGVNKMYIKPSLTLPQSPVLVRKTNYGCTDDMAVILNGYFAINGEVFKDNKSHYISTTSSKEVYVDFYGSRLRYPELADTVWRFSSPLLPSRKLPYIVYHNNSTFLYYRNGILYDKLDGFDNISVEVMGNGLCFKDVVGPVVVNITWDEYYRNQIGEPIEVMSWNGSWRHVNLSSGVFIEDAVNGINVVYQNFINCSDCVFENTSLINANISSLSKINNITIYGYVDVGGTSINITNVRGYGYMGGVKRGSGMGPAAGRYVEAGASGGGHGGFGGRGIDGETSLVAGSMKLPVMGSGGAGDNDTSYGTPGGGLILVKGTHVILKNVSLNGVDGIVGAGAGGGLLVNATFLDMVNVTVNGGDSLTQGAGGGGRIVLFASNTHMDLVSARGGDASYLAGQGGVGTIYIKNDSGTFVIISNMGVETPNQAYLESIDDGAIVYIIDGAYAEQRTPWLNLSEIYILNNSVLSHARYPALVPVNITFDRLILDNTSSIDVVFKGIYPLFYLSDEEVDLSPNFKSSLILGHSNNYVPFAGLIILNGSYAEINGTISADAGFGSKYKNNTYFEPFGGSGGKIFLYVDDLRGSGIITANEFDACPEDFDYGYIAFSLGYIAIFGSMENFTGDIYYFPVNVSCNTLRGTYEDLMKNNIRSWGGFYFAGNLTLVGRGVILSYQPDTWAVFRDKSIDNLFIGHYSLPSYPGEYATSLVMENVSFANLTISENSTLVVNQHIYADRVTIQNKGRIWAIGPKSSYIREDGIYYGAGPQPSCTNDRYNGLVGASHGGLGNPVLFKNHTLISLCYPKAYDDPRWPTEEGSTPPCSSTSFAGGVLYINASVIENNGTLSASGIGGASGGSVILIGNITNKGVIEARGGNSSYLCKAVGGGGRIAIYYDDLEMGEITAKGGSDNNGYLPTGVSPYGGAGTIYLYNISSNKGYLWIKDGNSWGYIYPSTPLPNQFNDPILVENSVVSLWNNNQQLSNLTLINATLTHPPYPLSLLNYINLTVTYFFMDENSSINVSGLGYGPAFSPKGLGPGGGTRQRSGGSYGGSGGYYGGPTYGILTNPIYLGSSGSSAYSDSNYYYGGAGGGMIILFAEHAKFGNYSSIDASGHTGKSYLDGGGSGGSILLFLKNASGILFTFSKGANSNYGGAGGGGRIAIYLGYNNSFVPVYNVSGGSSYYSSRKGGVGTFYMGPYYYLEAILLPLGPFNISDNVSLQVDLKVWNGSEFESYGSGEVYMLHNEQSAINLSSGEEIPTRLDFSYVGLYEGNLTFRKAGKKQYNIVGRYGPDFPSIFVPYNPEVYGLFINMTRDKLFYMPNTLALINVEAYYYPTNFPYVGNISFYYKNTLLQNMFINRTTTLIFNVGSEAGFHELVAHVN